MSDELKVWIRYGVCTVVGLLIALLIALSRGVFSMEPMERYRVLADAFTIPGVLMLCFGGLFFVSNAGAMNGIGYAMSHLFRAIVPGRNTREEETYLDYVERKREKRVHGYGFIVHTGLGFLAVSLVFILLFYQYYK